LSCASTTAIVHESASSWKNLDEDDVGLACHADPARASRGYGEDERGTEGLTPAARAILHGLHATAETGRGGGVGRDSRPTWPATTTRVVTASASE
jgi:hypothetical protein